METELEVTKMSSKGQIVLPKSIRSRLHIKRGTLFAMRASKKLILLKMIDDPILKEDLDALESADKAWKQIEQGKYTRYTKDAYLKKMAAW